MIVYSYFKEFLMQNVIKKIPFLTLLFIANSCLAMQQSSAVAQVAINVHVEDVAKDQQRQYPVMRSINFVGHKDLYSQSLGTLTNRCMKEIAKSPILPDFQDLDEHGESNGKTKQVNYQGDFSDDALEKFNLKNAQTNALINTLWRSTITYSDDPEGYRSHLQNVLAHVIHAAKPMALVKAQKVLRELQLEQAESNHACRIESLYKVECYVGIFSHEDEIMTKEEASQKIRIQMRECWPQITGPVPQEVAETNQKIFTELILILHSEAIQKASYQKEPIDNRCGKTINGFVPELYKETLQGGLNRSRNYFTRNLNRAFFLFSWSARRLTEPYYMEQIARLTHTLETREEKNQALMREKDRRIETLERALHAAAILGISHAQHDLSKVDTAAQNPESKNHQ